MLLKKKKNLALNSHSFLSQATTRKQTQEILHLFPKAATGSSVRGDLNPNYFSECPRQGLRTAGERKATASHSEQTRLFSLNTDKAETQSINTKSSQNLLKLSSSQTAII